MIKKSPLFLSEKLLYIDASPNSLQQVQQCNIALSVRSRRQFTNVATLQQLQQTATNAYTSINPAIYNWKFTVTSVTTVTLPSNPAPQACSQMLQLPKSVTNCNNSLRSVELHPALQACSQMLQLLSSSEATLLFFLLYT
jgi:hypothetical protein